MIEWWKYGMVDMISPKIASPDFMSPCGVKHRLADTARFIQLLFPVKKKGRVTFRSLHFFASPSIFQHSIIPWSHAGIPWPKIYALCVKKRLCNAIS